MLKCLGPRQDIAIVGAGVNRWRAPMQKLNDPRRSLTPLDPDGTLFCGRPDRWRVWSWHISHVSPAGLYPLTYSGSKRRRVKVKRLTQE
jgi:hypothetical protein